MTAQYPKQPKAELCGALGKPSSGKRLGNGSPLPLLLAPAVLSQSRELLGCWMCGSSSPVVCHTPPSALMSCLLPFSLPFLELTSSHLLTDLQDSQSRCKPQPSLREKPVVPTLRKLGTHWQGVGWKRPGLWSGQLLALLFLLLVKQTQRVQVISLVSHSQPQCDSCFSYDGRKRSARCISEDLGGRSRACAPGQVPKVTRKERRVMGGDDQLCPVGKVKKAQGLCLKQQNRDTLPGAGPAG